MFGRMALIAKYILLIICQSVIVNSKVFNIGAVLSSNEAMEVFGQAVKDVNADINMLPPGVKLNDTTMLMNPNPIQTALAVCKELIQNSVYAVVVSRPQMGDLPPSSVSYTCGFYRIPVVGISSRDSVFSDKNIHVSFVRTVPPYSHQADVWISLLPQFSWRSVIIIYSSDQDGESLVGRFQNLADDKEIRVEKTVEYEPGLSNLTDLLMELKLVQSRVILLYASARDAQVIYHDAENLNMTGSGYAWIVTEQALEPPNTPIGVLGLQLINQSAETAHIKDSVKILGSALRAMYHSFNISEPPKGCTNKNDFKETGQAFLRYIMEQSLLYGETGKVAFDKSGDRLFAEYKVINIQGVVSNLNNTQADEAVQLVEVGSYMFSRSQGQMKLTINESKIIWPGPELKIPEGYMIPSKLKVVTIIEKPFVYVRQIDRGESCNEKDFEVYCPHYNNSSDEPIHYCCYGYCIRLLTELAKEINFTYDLHICEDNMYGNIVKKNGSEGKGWNGMIGELLDEKADMIVAPLTINPERAAAIEFSKPFKYQGITILERKPPKSSTLDSFLQPFQHTLWILVMFSVHVVALVLYLLDRFSPFGRFKLANSEDTEEDALNLSSAVWFAWGVLLNSGIGEGTPRSFSARVMGMVWAGFAMIMVASYTANLAAFLVLDRPESSIIGINDPRLRNPQENFTYATVKGSSVDMYFRRQVELSTMYRTMEAYNYDHAEDAIQAVKDGKLNAFIWDSSRLEYEAAKDCDLVTAGELFGRSGYGIGLRKYSPWADRVTLTILGFHESGFMEDLDSNWILVHNDKCDTDENAPATLGLTNMAGVFILVGGGIAAGIFLIFIEIVYKRHQMVKQKEMELARSAADRWRGTIEKRRTLRLTLPKQRPDGSNGVGDGTGSGSGSTKEEESQAERMSTSLRNNPVYNADSCSDNFVV